MKNVLKVRVGDTVIINTGKDKKKTGKVVAVDAARNRVQVEGASQVVKHNKPRQFGQPGSLEKRTGFIDASNVTIVHPTKKSVGSRIGYSVDAKGVKKRVYRQADNKEIK